jgi:twitching motility protein PilT
VNEPRNVLIVEDEPAVRRLHGRLLTDAGYTCIETETISDGLAALQRMPIDVALLDVRLPNGSGMVLAHQIHEHFPATAAIMVTGVAEFSSAQEAMRAGAVDYLVKPVPADVLLKAVAAAETHRALAAAAKPARPTFTAPKPAAAPETDVDVWIGSHQSSPIDEMFRAMCALGASDLHLTPSLPPMVRKDGGMRALDPHMAPLRPSDVIDLLHPIVPGKNREEFEMRHDSDFAYELEGVARFRGNIFMDRKGMGAVFRVIPSTITTAEELGLSPHILKLCELQKGLVLVTGPTGSGKSTTLAALIDRINRTRNDHIITMEDPIEFVHANIKCVVNQREVHTHTRSFKDALRAALREDPDVLLIGEMRDLETVQIAIETAETGHLVFGTLHTTTAMSTVDRIVDQFPADGQAQIRIMLADSLKAVIAQTLCRKIDGGRVAALEVLLVNGAVSNLIREGKTSQIQSLMQVNKQAGMTTFNDSLYDLLRNNKISMDEAVSKAFDKAGFETLLKRVPPTLAGPSRVA